MKSSFRKWVVGLVFSLAKGEAATRPRREIRDSKGASVRGLLVDVTESQYRREQSFVDADEIPELLKGFDALLEVKENPTQFKKFEVRYTTRGQLVLTAYDNARNVLGYSVKAGRTIGRLHSSTREICKIFERCLLPHPKNCGIRIS